MAEGDGLLNRCGGNLTAGSNPVLSADCKGMVQKTVPFSRFGALAARQVPIAPKWSQALEAALSGAFLSLPFSLPRQVLLSIAWIPPDFGRAVPMRRDNADRGNTDALACCGNVTVSIRPGRQQ